MVLVLFAYFCKGQAIYIPSDILAIICRSSVAVIDGRFYKLREATGSSSESAYKHVVQI
jgi:hypothetical protein